VAATSKWVFAGFDWRLGFVLGAVVATTDAIAATAIAKRIGLPRRIVDILEGESLVNDATGLLALEFGVAIVVSGQRRTVGAGLSRLTYLTIAGLALGLIVGTVVEWIHRHIDDGPIEITLTLVVPYVAYLTAEAIHASGVLACSVRAVPEPEEFPVLLAERAHASVGGVDALTFVPERLVFVRIGLQMPSCSRGFTTTSFVQLVKYGALFSAI